MPETDRLSGDTDWIDVGFIQRERTPSRLIRVGIQLHLTGLSLSNTKQYLDTLGIERSRTAIHNWSKRPISSRLVTVRRNRWRSTKP